MTFGEHLKKSRDEKGLTNVDNTYLSLLQNYLQHSLIRYI